MYFAELSNVAESPEAVLVQYHDTDFPIGLTLALCSTILIGSSFVIKKIALIRICHAGYIRAGAGGFGYLKEWLWWLGFLMMGLGEIANFVAYAFAPASLITPLGALSVIISAFLSSKYLKERLNIIGKLGCVLCLIGSTIIIIHSPKEEEVKTLENLINKLQQPLFIIYVMIVIITTLSIYFYYGPKYGSQYVIIYVILCSVVGSLTVMACKGLGLSIKEALSVNGNELNNWFIYFFAITVIICICIQMDYLNKALDLFNTSIVTPIYYVLFTTMVLTASSILFKEWQHLNNSDVVGNLCGFFVIIIGIFMLHGFKDLNINLGDIRSFARPKYASFNNRLADYERYEYGNVSLAGQSFRTSKLILITLKLEMSRLLCRNIYFKSPYIYNPFNERIK